LDLANTKVSGDIKILETALELAYIDLSGTKVQGDIQVFQACVQLVELNLDKTYVQGDIQAFQATRKLASLKLHGTHVFGDIIAFHATAKLATIALALTHASGDITVFRSTQLLETLELASTLVFGDIKVFEATKDLEHLDLSSTKVVGNIQVFKSTDKLEGLYLSATQIFGDIAALTNASALKNLYLGQSNVSGNISALWAADMLEEVQLASTRVYGDIQVFKGKESLTKLLCSAIWIEGDVTVFENMEGLEMVDLSLTHVTGDIAVFQGTDLLFHLVLASTLVFGDIERLVPVGRDHPYEVIDLSRTNILGNIWVFQNANDLLELYLADTKVAGSIDGILKWDKVRVVDLSRTQVTGELRRSWRGRCKHLQVLKLSDSRARFVPRGDDLIELMDLKQMNDRLFNGNGGANALLPALTSLEVSGCQLNAPVQNLILPLAACEHLGTIKAANCGLQDGLPSLDPMPPTTVDREVRLGERSYLASSLETLDLSGNNLSYIAAIPPACQHLKLKGNQQPLLLAEGELSKAVQFNVLIDLRSTLLQTDTTNEAKELLAKKILQNTSERVYFPPGQGYSCYDLNDDANLLITPSLFLPEEWCACMPGWSGNGPNCTECEENTFSVGHNAPHCTPCPESATSAKGSKSLRAHDGTCKTCPQDSTAPRGSTSPNACTCPSGQELFHSSNGHLLCGCRERHALMSTECVDCDKLNLECRAPGMTVKKAQPKAGYVRMDMDSWKVYSCLSKARCSNQNCTQGYVGALCADCAPGYRAVQSACVPCSKDRRPQFHRLPVLAVATVAVSIAAIVVYLWRCRASLLSRPASGLQGRWKVLQDLSTAQAPVLLQLCQLWAALASLSSTLPGADDPAHGFRVEEDTWQSWAASFWELPYVQTLQLSLAAFKDSVALQCSYDGALVRFFWALAGPMLPVTILAACGLLEVAFRTKGIATALRVLTLLFIGGASSCAELLTCQYVDGADEPLGEHSFRLHMPFLRCHDDSSRAFWADVVAYGCSSVYGVFIPLALLHLFLRQHLLMRSCRSVAAVTEVGHNGNLTVSLQSLTADGKLLFKDFDQVAGRLSAAAAARMSVSRPGHLLKLWMEKDVIHLQDMGPASSTGDLPAATIDEDVMMASWIASEEEMESGSALRCRTISEMLMERCTLEEAQLSERTLTGAKGMLFKYSSCSHVWMEVLLKLVSVALISFDCTNFSFKLAVAISLVTGATIALARPYVQPQVNTLHSFCFACLAVASVGFYHHILCLTRAALLLPFLLASLQLLRPDSAEALSVRLFDELTNKMHDLQDGKEVHLAAKICHFA